MRLVVYCSGQLAGFLDMQDSEPFYGFTYSEDYLHSGSAEPLSLSLPLQADRFDGCQAQPFFEGLLPEGDVRVAIARQLGISQNSPAKLLRALGRDCAGDVAVLEEDDPYQPPSTDCYLPLEDGLRKLAANPYAEIAKLRAGNRLSLAGGQEKIGLYHDSREAIDNGWYVPVQGSPSTHIVKPQVGDRYPLLALNEFICMRLAETVGLNVAHVDLLELEVPVLIVARFDRVRAGKKTDNGLDVYCRLRQEDACQALGFTSDMKYELDGGPSITSLGALLLAHSADYLQDRRDFVRLILFNYLVGNCDAHAKNYSLALQGTTLVRLAPAYDLLSTTLYDGDFGSQLSRSMGMRIGKHANIDKVDAHDFSLLAADLGLSDSVLQTERMQLETALMDAQDSMRVLASNVGGEDAINLVDRLYAGIRGRTIQ